MTFKSFIPTHLAKTHEDCISMNDASAVDPEREQAITNVLNSLGTYFSATSAGQTHNGKKVLPTEDGGLRFTDHTIEPS